MEEGETVSILSRKELRKQKLMEYLAAKGRLKLPNPKPYLRDGCQVKGPVISAPKVVKGKENKVPADTSKYEGRKIQTLAAQSTKHSARRAFGVTNKLNVKSNIPPVQQNAKFPSATSGPAQPELNQNQVLTGKGPTVSSKSSMSAVSHLKKKQVAGMQSSGRATSIAASNSTFRNRSNAPWPGTVKSAIGQPVSVRMSLGPIVKTKTGLVPAVTQPRNTNSHLTRTFAPTADTTTAASVSNKGLSSASSSVSTSQKSAMGHRKPLPNTALNNPANERAAVSLTASAGIKVEEQNKSNAKPLLGKQSQLSCNRQLPSGLKSVPKCTVASIKPERRGGISNTNKSGGEPTDRSTRQKSEGAGEKKGKPCKVPSQTSLKPASRGSFRPVSGIMRAAVVELGGKTKTCEQTQSKRGHRSSNVPPQQTTAAPVISQTVPQPARTIRLTCQTTYKTKTSKVPVSITPHTEGKKVTAAQEERLRKLQEWREAKGISYKRPPMPVKPQVRRTVAVPQPFWTTLKEEDEAHSLICAVDRSLADCIKLLGEGCPPDQVKEVLLRLPAVSQKFAKYWICRARLMEQEGNLDVLPMFEEAVRVVLEPVDELRTVVFEILKKKDEIQASEAHEKKEDQIPTVESSPESSSNPMMTPKPVRVLICGERGDSSVVKYKITETPGGPPSQQREPALVNGQEVRFFTPVRRSVRIERASLRYPASLQDHDLCVASYNDLISEGDTEKSDEQEGRETSPSVDDTPMYIYRQNEALKDKVFVQLVCD
ncbi:cytoskeleton-associated protein 2-like [Toxotes jaculatrix]|uniref:cytoskeleton-associated protein 2-like n=1 Tax=Toxotes jaculatrix TaxID=941984 RepID=UPI001B3B03C8|nr:cytoskeleton-associated protein 2-like [Toxotes jaculatrix]